MVRSWLGTVRYKLHRLGWKGSLPPKLSVSQQETCTAVLDPGARVDVVVVEQAAARVRPGVRLKTSSTPAMCIINLDLVHGSALGRCVSGSGGS